MNHQCHDCETTDNVKYYPQFKKWLCYECADEWIIAHEDDLFDEKHDLDIID